MIRIIKIKNTVGIGKKSSTTNSKSNIKFKGNIERLIFFFAIFLLCIHVFACIYVLIAKLEDDNYNWINSFNLSNTSDVEQYITAFYYITTTIVTVGYGDITPKFIAEKVFAVILMLIGVLSNSIAVGSLTTLLSSMDSKDVKLNEKMSFLKELCEEYKISYDFYLNVRKSLIYEHNKSTLDKFQFLNDLPPNLRLELSYIIHSSLLKKFPYFKNKSKQFIATIGPMLKPLKVIKNDYVYMEGDPIDEIYFMISGRSSMVITEYNDLEFLSIDNGYIFGETDLLGDAGKRKFTVKAKTDCELYILEMKDLQKISNDFNEVLNELLDHGEVRQKKIEELKSQAVKAYNECIDGENLNLDTVDKLSPVFTTIKVLDEQNDANNTENIRKVMNKQESLTFTNATIKVKNKSTDSKTKNALLLRKGFHTKHHKFKIKEMDSRSEAIFSNNEDNDSNRDDSAKDHLGIYPFNSFKRNSNPLVSKGTQIGAFTDMDNSKEEKSFTIIMDDYP